VRAAERRNALGDGDAERVEDTARRVCAGTGGVLVSWVHVESSGGSGEMSEGYVQELRCSKRVKVRERILWDMLPRA